MEIYEILKVLETCLISFHIIHVMSFIQEKSGMFLKLVSSVTRSVIILVLWLNSWGQKILFPHVCRYYYICNVPHNKFY
jgi:hypothetical protein